MWICEPPALRSTHMFRDMFACVCTDVFDRFLLGWIHVRHMFVRSPVLCAKHSQSFLFHLNQSAYEFFYELHEVGSIYVGMCVHRICRSMCVFVCARGLWRGMSFTSKYTFTNNFAQSAKRTLSARCRCRSPCIFNTAQYGSGHRLPQIRDKRRISHNAI